jgi:autotransporter-associated beta strand protein
VGLMATLNLAVGQALAQEIPDYPGLRDAIEKNAYPLWYRERVPPVNQPLPLRFALQNELWGPWLTFFEHNPDLHGPLNAYNGETLALHVRHEGVHPSGNVSLPVSYSAEFNEEAALHLLYVDSGNDLDRSFTITGIPGSRLRVGRLINIGAAPLRITGSLQVSGYTPVLGSEKPLVELTSAGDFQRYYTFGDSYHFPGSTNVIFENETSFSGWVGGPGRAGINLPAWSYDSRDYEPEESVPNTYWGGFGFMFANLFDIVANTVRDLIVAGYNAATGNNYTYEESEGDYVRMGGEAQNVTSVPMGFSLEFRHFASMHSERIYSGTLRFRDESTLMVENDTYLSVGRGIRLPPAVHATIHLHDDAEFTANSYENLLGAPHPVYPEGLPPGGAAWLTTHEPFTPIFANTARVTLSNRSRLVLLDHWNFEPTAGWGQTPVAAVSAWVEANDITEVSAEASYSINSGWMVFRDNARLTATATNAISGGRQQFYGISRLITQAPGVILGGEQAFYDSAKLPADLPNTVVGGQQYFHGGILEINASHAVIKGTQHFNGAGALVINQPSGISGGVQKFGSALPLWIYGDAPRADAGAMATLTIADAIVGGTQEFRLDSALTLEQGAALSGGEQFFFETSELRLDAAGAVVGGTQEFYGESAMVGNHQEGYGGAGAKFYENSSLDLQARDVLAAGTTEFRGSSTLEANSTFAYAGNQTAEFFNTSAFRAHQPDSLYGGLVNFRDQSRLLVLGANAISGGEQRFHTQAKLEVTSAGAIAGGSQIFIENSRLEAKTADAIAGGVQSFAGSAKLLAQVDKAIMHGTQVFTGNSSLESSASGGVAGGTQTFLENATLQASTGFAVRGGTQTFRGSAVLVGSASNAVAGGDQIFEADSRLQLTSPSALTGGTQTFSGFARLDVAATQAIAGGTQEFLENSRMDATAADAVIGLETLVFRGTTALAATQSNAITGGNITFYDNARLLAQAGQAVNGGTQEFFETSGLTTSISQGLRGGTQNFRDSSTLISSAQFGINGGTQHFHNNSRLRLTAGNAVTAGLQLFYNTSSLSLEAGNGIQLGGNQRFYHNSHLTITAGGAAGLRGGIQEFYGFSEMRVDGDNGVGGSSVAQFYDQSRLLARDAFNAIIGGTQNFHDNSELVTGFSPAITGGTQNFRDDSILRARGSTISGGTQNFYHRSKAITSGTDSITASSINLYDFSTLEVTSTNSLRRPMIHLRHSSRIEIKANLGLNAGTLGTQRVTVGFADPDEFGPGGTLQLGGFSITVGTLESLTPGAGIVENRNPEAPALLTVSPPTSGGKDSVFSGLIRDGFDGGTPGFPVVPSAPLSLAKAGPQALILEGANTFSGGVSLSSGSVIARHDSALGTGLVSLTAGSTLRLENGRTIANDILNKAGTVIAADGLATLTGTITGDGTFSGPFSLAGVLSPGESPGVLSFQGDLVLEEDNHTLLEIGGLERGTEHDGINVTGKLELGGVLTLVALDGFVPSAGDTFQIFHAGTLEGEFVSVDATDFLPPGLAIDPKAIEQQGALVVIEEAGQSDPLGDWREQFFGTRDNVGQAADDHDTLGDGMTNLMRFALGGTPNTPAASVLPRSDLATEEEESFLTFTHRRRAGAGTGSTLTGYTIDGITYTIEVSENLADNWHTGPMVLREPAAPVDNEDGTVTVTVQILPALSPGSPARFVRLRVTREAIQTP